MAMKKNFQILKENTAEAGNHSAVDFDNIGDG
jgi:hypothetical protein